MPTPMERNKRKRGKEKRDKREKEERGERREGEARGGDRGRRTDRLVGCRATTSAIYLLPLTLGSFRRGVQWTGEIRNDEMSVPLEKTGEP